MKVFVTGVKGQLGHDIMLELERQQLAGVGVDIEEMDITDPAAVRRVITEAAPDAVIHCAAWTAVDAAEDNEAQCRRVNAEGTANIAEVCRDLKLPMMYFSTDYVFNGEGERPWEPEDPAEPLNIYGQTKYEGEQAVRSLVPDRHFILRIQWVYGLNGKNFVKTMLKLSEDHDRLTVVNDQVGSPTYTPDIARLAAHQSAGRKGCPEGAVYTVVLNKADSEKEEHVALEICRMLAGEGIRRIIVTGGKV